MTLPTPHKEFKSLAEVPQSTPNLLHPTAEPLKLETTRFPSKTFSISSSLPMEKIVKCKEFSGYPQENALKFLSEFESYATLYDLPPGDKRRIAAFHLHLRGPALTWFNSLSESAKSSWSAIEVLFKEKYVNFDWQSSRVMMTTEIFQSIRLSPGQSIEDYYCSLVEKGQILQKPDHEILSKFVSGLPEKMSFFVRAGQPKDLQTAVTSAKMAEACGYRQENEMVQAIKGATKTPPNTAENRQDIRELRDQVDKLSLMMSQMNTRQNSSTTKPLYNNRRPLQQGQTSQQQNRRPSIQNSSTIECYGCHGHGHIHRDCNWNGRGEMQSAKKCQLCDQQGHTAKSCKTITQFTSGNTSNPGDRHGRPERE